MLAAMPASDDRSLKESKQQAPGVGAERTGEASADAARTDGSNGATEEAFEEDDGPTPTPFDHPLFLPVLLFAGMLWFGFDGWINQNPDMLEHRTFNRVGFAVLTLLALWFGRKGYAEFRQDRAQRAAELNERNQPETQAGASSSSESPDRRD